MQELPNTVEDVHKQMRAVKKKLNAIAELDEKVKADSTYPLSAEQKDKMSKKTELFAEYAHLEQLLVRCQVRERAAEKAQVEDHCGVSAEAVDSTNTLAQATLHIPPSPSQQQPSPAIAAPAEKLSAPEKVLVSPASKCDSVPQVKSVKKGKVKGISLQEFNTILESSSAAASSRGSDKNSKVGKAPSDFAAWGRSLDAHKSTPAAPASATMSAGSSAWSVKSVPVAVAVPEILTPNSKAAPAVPPVPPVPPAVSPAVSTESSLKKAPISTPDAEFGAPRRTRALLDFMPATKSLTPATPSPVKAGWAAASPAPSSAAKAASKVAASSPMHAVAPIRFSEIQRTEETARQSSTIATLQGNSRPWFVERHQRAASIEEVVRQQALDRAEEEEIARAVAEIDRVSLLAAKAQEQATGSTARGGKADGNKTNKKKKPSGVSSAATKK